MHTRYACTNILFIKIKNKFFFSFWQTQTQRCSIDRTENGQWPRKTNLPCSNSGQDTVWSSLHYSLKWHTL